MNKCVPKIDNLYVTETDIFNKLETIISSKKFFPTFLWGHRGTGKSTLVEQVCARLGRECYRLNFTRETEDSDLLGRYTLVNGNTVFEEGPVVEALRKGAVLLLDEVDLSNFNSIMCLNPVLEGKGVFLKQKNEFVEAQTGFTVIATGNTKGYGSEDGKYIGTTPLNAAFLDRFIATFHVKYPSKEVELSILLNNLRKYFFEDAKTINDIDDSEIIKNKKVCEDLCSFAQEIREGYDKQTQDDTISTRTLINIIKSYAVFKDIDYALDLALEKYQDEIKVGWLTLWKNIFHVDPDNTPQTSDPSWKKFTVNS